MIYCNQNVNNLLYRRPLRSGVNVVQFKLAYSVPYETYMMKLTINPEPLTGTNRQRHANMVVYIPSDISEKISHIQPAHINSIHFFFYIL